ncbi:zinc ABC transporter substrate-binding protein [Planktomarina sp.]|nr:zinc ABC transporter substrate-binding protein [Planktomarina sp.]MDA9100844.1 zinc ABC transporter substrate-binding protein [Planktomarina sp.]
MSRKLFSISAVATLLGSSAIADVPNVSVDIAPLHSLVASVMNGVGVPNLIIPPGSSPHDHQLRPSEAKAMQDANIVFWMGEELTPWMENAVKTLSSNASVTKFLENDKTSLLEFREGALFEAHDHDDEHDDDDEEHDEQGHGSHDPHAWLSPNNAKAWLDVIAAQLSSYDTENAGVYFTNAASAKSEIEMMIAEINLALDPIRGGKFIVFHDAYQYFENDFDFQASGAISIGDASDPSPARIAKIQKRIRDEEINCILAEPQFNANLVQTVMEGSQANTNVIDPLGAGLKPGILLYNKLIKNMAQSLADCF